MMGYRQKTKADTDTVPREWSRCVDVAARRVTIVKEQEDRPEAAMEAASGSKKKEYSL